MTEPPQHTAAARLAALHLARNGHVYDLSSGWFRGMPMHPAHPTFDVITYRTPRGQQLHRDLPLTTENNSIGFGFISEMIMGTMHSGTHVDAPNHIVVDGQWCGGGRVEESLGDFGTVTDDATTLAPMIHRGVLLDVPAALGHDGHLPANFPVGPAELERTCAHHGVAIEPNTLVLVRTGLMSRWPDAAAMSAIADAGITVDGARWLVERGAIGVGADTPTIEVAPSGVDGSPQPAHVFLIQENGLPILEWVYLEELARDAVYEFLFVALPLHVRGATGSFLSPIAVV